MALSRIEEPHQIGDWTRISVLGSGGFGTVVLWRSCKTNDAIAVKKCKLHCPSSLTPKQKERWRNEVQIMKELDHPNIIKYKHLPTQLETELNKFNPTKLPLLPMEYCQKGNLRHTLTQPTNLTGLTEETVKNVLLDISSAVLYLHKHNITHRDIKPDNIVLHDCPERKGGTIYKLIDLGYAKELGDATVSFVGTLYYLAPEIFETKKYDCSVDYWSLGVLAFEIICGVLPFPGTLTPVERYHMIKDKGLNDICIYKSNLGNLTYSSDLFKENQISSCLKSHMENWIRRALQYNPKLRSLPFPPNSTNIFDELNSILKKRIVTVFSVFKYEFYSYEFDECTRLSTLQQWISRDTQIPEKEQLLLTKLQLDGCDKETLLTECLAEEKCELFMFRRTELFHSERNRLPRLVKLMFEKATENFNWREIKAMYSHSIHYITEDTSLAKAFSEAMDLFLTHLRTLVSKVQKKGDASRQNIVELLAKVNCFNKAIKGQQLNHKNVVLAKRFLRLFSSIERCVQNDYYLRVNIAKWGIKVDAMRNMYSQLNITKLPQLQELSKIAVHLLQMTAERADNNNNTLSASGMLKIICMAMKMKDSLLSDTNLLEFSKYLFKATDHLESLMSWINLFDSHIESLSKSFNSMKDDAFTASRQPAEVIQGVPCTENNTPLDDLIVGITDPKLESALKKSEFLTSRFQEGLNESIAGHKKICEEVLSFLTDASLCDATPPL